MDSFVNRMVGAAKLNAATYEEVEADPTATGQAMGVVLIHSIATGIGAAGQGGILGLIVGTITAIIGWGLWSLIIYIVGTKIMKRTETSTSIGELLRTTGFAASPGVFKIVGIVPVLGGFLSFLVVLWMFAAMVVAVRQALDYSKTGHAIVVCLIGFLIYLPLGLFLWVFNALSGAP